MSHGDHRMYQIFARPATTCRMCFVTGLNARLSHWAWLAIVTNSSPVP